MSVYSPTSFNLNSFLPPSNYDSSPTNSNFWSSSSSTTSFTPSSSKSVNQGISWEHEDETDFFKSLEPFYQSNLQQEENDDNLHISDDRMNQILIASGARSPLNVDSSRPEQGIRLVDIDLGLGSDDRSEDLIDTNNDSNNSAGALDSFVSFGKNRKRKSETGAKKLDTIVEETLKTEFYVFKSEFPARLHTILQVGNPQDEIYPLLFWDPKGTIVIVAMQNFETNRRIFRQAMNLDSLPDLYRQLVLHNFERLPPSVLYLILAKAEVREGEFLHFIGFRHVNFTRSSEESIITSILSSENPSVKPINRILDIKVGKQKKGNDEDRNELLKVKLKMPPRKGDIVV